MINRLVIPILAGMVATLAFITGLSASEKIFLDDGFISYKAGKNIEILEDREGKLGFDDIRKPDIASRFRRSDTEVPNFGYTGSRFWIRIATETKFSDPTPIFLELAYTHLDNVILYMVKNDGTVITKKGGRKFPFIDRDLLYRNLVFILRSNDLDNANLYLQIDSEASLQIPLIFWSPVAFTETIRIEQYLFGIFYGIMLVMAVYNLFLFLFTRDRNYLYYVLYIAGYGLVQMSYNGFAYELLWPGAPWWNIRSIPFLIGFSFLAIITFTINFLNTAINTPAVHAILKITRVLSIVVIALALFAPYRPGIVLGLSLMVIDAVIIFIAAIWCIAMKYRPARYFLIAWTSFLLGIMSMSLKSLGILPNMFVTNYAIQIGSSMEVILLSIALADRINILRREKIMAERGALRQKERVRALQQDIAIARRIQDSILPANLPMTKKISTHVRYLTMETLGGDFYDFMEKEQDHIGVIIADVLGHGVPAALIASMVKMAFCSEQVNMHEPAALMRRMNETLIGKSNRQFLTAAYTYIDLETYTVSHASGGHLPMVLIQNGSDDPVEVKPRGPIIGCFREAAYHSRSLESSNAATGVGNSSASTGFTITS